MSSLFKELATLTLSVCLVVSLSGCWLAGEGGGPAESGPSQSSASDSGADDADSDHASGDDEGSEEGHSKEDDSEKDHPKGDHGDKDHAKKEHAGEEHGKGGDHGHEPHVGHPKKEPELLTWRNDMAIYSLAIFLLLLFVLTKFAWGPIVESIDAREESIRKTIEDANLARQRAEELLAEHAKKLDSVQDEVREIIAEARRDADHTKNDIVSKAHAEAEIERNRAIEEIRRAKDQSLKEIFDTAADQVANATENVIGRTLSEDDRNRLVDESLSQFAGQVGENN